MKKDFFAIITRCKDEFFIKEFVKYYLLEGADHIYIIDDNSYRKDIYDDIKFFKNVSIIYSDNIIKNDSSHKLYSKIRGKYEWLAYIDVDEFIVPKKNYRRTIVEELKHTFDKVDCIKIPWVMMSSSGKKYNPDSILRDNVWRWNHDLKHPHHIHKFRCRYDSIEVKCIFKPEKFKGLIDHHPIYPIGKVSIVDSIDLNNQELDPFYGHLSEEKIERSIFSCYHFRLISRENNINKLKTNKWYIEKKYSLDDLESSDYSEIFDNTLSVRMFKNKIFLIGFNRVGTRSLHYLFKNNKLSSVHWDKNNLAKTMMINNENGLKLLSCGEVIDEDVNSHGYYRDIQVFSDITYHEFNLDAKDFYKKLDEQYPESKFILNIRDVDKWLLSRLKHSNGKITKILKSYHDVEEEELLNIWRDMWINTIDEMKIYFKNRSNFMIFDIENHDVDSIKEFFKDDFILNEKEYGHIL